MVSQPHRASYDGPRGRIDIAYLWTRGGIEVADATGGDPAIANAPAVVAFAPEQVILQVDGVRHRFDIARGGGAVWVDSAFGMVRLTPVERLPEPAPSREPGSLIAPMPGNVVRLEAAAGDTVTAGQSVLVLEAMKMEHLVVAPAAGLIAELRVTPGAQVAAGDVLAIVTTPPTAEES